MTTATETKRPAKATITTPTDREIRIERIFAALDRVLAAMQ
jgi:hypothetical protein